MILPRLLITLLLPFLFACTPHTIRGISESNLLSRLPEEIPHELEADAGCYFSTIDLVGSGYVVARNIDRSPWLGLNSGPVRLQVIAEDIPGELGGVGLVQYDAPGIEVRIELRAPTTCPNPDDDCSPGSEMTGRMHLRVGNRREVVDVVGGCGC